MNLRRIPEVYSEYDATNLRLNLRTRTISSTVGILLLVLLHIAGASPNVAFTVPAASVVALSFGLPFWYATRARRVTSKCTSDAAAVSAARKTRRGWAIYLAEAFMDLRFVGASIAVVPIALYAHLARAVTVKPVIKNGRIDLVAQPSLVRLQIEKVIADVTAEDRRKAQKALQLFTNAQNAIDGGDITTSLRYLQQSTSEFPTPAAYLTYAQLARDEAWSAYFQYYGSGDIYYLQNLLTCLDSAQDAATAGITMAARQNELLTEFLLRITMIEALSMRLKATPDRDQLAPRYQGARPALSDNLARAKSLARHFGDSRLSEIVAQRESFVREFL